MPFPGLFLSLCVHLMSQKTNPFIIFFLIVGGPLIVLGFIYGMIQVFVFQPLDASGSEVVFEVEAGEQGVSIIQRLRDEGLIKNSYVLFAYSVYTGRYQQMKAGRYLLSPAMNMAEIIDVISRGQALPEVVLTFPEGLNLRQWQERIEEQFTEIDLLSYSVGLFQDEFDFLSEAPAEASLEGYLYPDTYYFDRQTKAEPMIRRFLANFERQLDDLIKESRAKGKNLHDLVIIASLLEKEVPADDRPLVSGIIQRRLEIGMPLQIDATVTYLTGRPTARISIEETRIDSPYNTYLYRGLPYGPISNFSRASFEAALYPEPSDYLFYLSKPDGETIFSRTLTEHNQAKAQYLR